MKFIEVPQFGGFDQLQIRQTNDPTPDDDQLLIDVRAAGINFADITAVSGHYPNVPSAPYRPGYEVAGEVSAVGAGVDGWKVGDRAMALIPDGGFVEKIAVLADGCSHIPSKLDFGAATALLVQGLTAFYLLDSAPLHEGETVLLASAAGGLGALAIQIARLKGAAKVIGLASPRGHNLVRELGAEPVDYRQKGWGKRVQELAPDGIHVFLDSTGALDGEGFDTLATGARWMIYGGQSDSDAPLAKSRVFEMLFKSITLRGFGLNPKQYDLSRGLQQLGAWVESGQLQVEANHRYPLTQVQRAFEDISKRKTHGKVVLEPPG